MNLPPAGRSDHLNATNATIDDIDCVLSGGSPFATLGELAKTGSSPGPLLPGDAFSYQVDLDFSGLGNGISVNELRDVLPAEFLLASSVVNNASGTLDCSVPPSGSSGPVICTIDSAIALGYQGSIDLTGSIAPDAAPGLLTNIATFELNRTGGGSVPVFCNASSTWEVQIVSPANVTADKTVSGSFVVGGEITYEVVLTNSGPAGQVDAPGNEFSDVLPPELDLDCDAVTIVSGGGAVGCNDGANTVVWSGPIPAGGSVTLSIGATIVGGTSGVPILNQGSFVFDADGDGTSESNGTTDDPGTPPDPDPTALVLGTVEVDEIPTAGAIGLLALALLLAVAALPRLRD